MSDERPHDPLAQLTAELDQCQAVAPLLARTTYSYYAAYIAEGFNEEQALALTMNTLNRPGEQ